jgi:ATP-dependent helicase HrpB
MPPPTPLPVEASVPELAGALAAPGGAAVLVAEPGAGKTTIVPLRLLDEPWMAGGQRIVVLEPRRVATRAAARRMAALLGEDVGGTVGYRTRDERRVSHGTRIEVVTEGMLTRRLQHDRTLDGVALVVFDELHERSLQADLGLALALDARRTVRPDLRLLAMSATLDVERVATLLGDATAVVRSEGRAHPVEVRWLPRTKGDRIEDAMAAAVRRALRDEPDGDVLAFLPGAGEIHRVQERLERDHGGAAGALDVRPLYGALPAHEQDAALRPSPTHGRRRVVLSTDIAETSLTVEGVRIVVDSGLARVPRHDTGTGMTRLRTVTTSKSSADQRAGRAGRTEPGVAYRLWSKLEQAGRRPHAEPEITQVDLAGLVLELAAWGTAEPGDLSFLDQPPRRAIEEARRLLVMLGALDGGGGLTDAGRAMAELPLHPRLARMVAASAPSIDGPVACVLAALLEERDVLRGRPGDLPADVALRVALVVDGTDGGRAVRTARARAEDIAQRAGTDVHGPVIAEQAGAVLAIAYPDRIAESRSRPGSTPGRFRLANGTDAWLPADDALATAPVLVVAELDGSRKGGRIHLAARYDG